MRIALVVRSLTIGGMERVAVTLADSFEKEGHESHLIYFDDKKYELPVSENIHLHSFQLKRSMKRTGIGYIWKVLAQILNLLIRKSFFVWSGLFTAPIFKYKLNSIEKEFGKFDLIIFRGQGTFEMIWPLHDNRFVFVNETTLYDDNYNFLKKIYSKLLFTNRNISSISNGVKESFNTLQKRANFPIKKHTLITNPIDINLTRKLAEEPIEGISKPYILGVGRFHPIKNFPLLIEAYAYAKINLGLKEDLVIVGDGKERGNIEKTIENLSLKDCVHLTGYTTNPYPWMKNAELFILSSKVEGLGMVLLEAMACNTDIVATNSPGGIKDVMTGQLSTHICQPDKILLAKKIVEVLNDPIKEFSNYLEPYDTKVITSQFIENFTP